MLIPCQVCDKPTITGTCDACLAAVKKGADNIARGNVTWHRVEINAR